MSSLLTPQEVAAVLRRPLDSIYALARTGQLRAVRDGRRYKFREEDVIAYIEERMTKPFKNSFTRAPDRGYAKPRRAPERNGA